MIRLVFYIGFSLALTLLIAWLMATPGTVQIELAGYRLQPGIGVSAVALIALIGLSILVWSLITRLLATPRLIAARTARNSQKKGVEALSNGFIALQAGDPEQARKLARDARNRLPGNAAADLLQARAELALGEWGAAREQYRTLIDNPKTALAALLGLYEQARAQDRKDAALTFALKAHTLAPALDWASEAVFGDLLSRGDWAGALKMTEAVPASTREEKDHKKRKQAVLHTAIAAQDESASPLNALEHTRLALKLSPDFVPAALISARIQSSRGETRKAASLLRRVWRTNHHPQVAELYASAQPGISPPERFKRLQNLIPSPPPDAPSAIVLARAAIEAGEWSLARNALANFAPVNPTQGTCVAMASIEEGQNNDFGRARQWLARAVTATRDPIWTADGMTDEEWAPVSPVTGQLDAFEWKAPTNALTASSGLFSEESLVEDAPETLAEPAPDFAESAPEPDERALLSEETLTPGHQSDSAETTEPEKT